MFGNFSHPLSLVSVILLQLSLVMCVSVLYFQCSNDDKNIYSHEVKLPNSAKYMVLFTSLFSSAFQNYICIFIQIYMIDVLILILDNSFSYQTG